MCVDFFLDLSASVGSGGRPWLSSVIEVQSNANGTDKIIRILNSMQLEGPVRIPGKFFLPGFVYHFKAKLCNFFKLCNFATLSSVVLSTVSPVVAIPGQSHRIVRTSEYLELTSDVFVIPSCNGIKSYSDLKLAWEILVDDVPSFSIKSISKEATKLVLPPFTLMPNTYYNVRLKAVYIPNGMSAQSSVSVYVQKGQLVAKIKGAALQSIRPASSLLLDGTNSIDEDYSRGSSSLSAVDTDLVFQWSCINFLGQRNSGSSKGNCGLILGRTNRWVSKIYIYTYTH